MSCDRSSRGDSRLKRRKSVIILRNHGRRTCTRCAKRELTDVPLYSSPVRSQLIEKLMFDGWDSTPSSFIMATNFGYVRSLNTMKPMSTAYGCPPSTASCVYV